MIEALFPDGVTVVHATAAMEEAPLHPEEAAQTRRMAPKRLREYRLGRACVREGLARLGVEGFAFLNDAERAPIWPEPIVGSLTHCRGLCAAAMVRRGMILSLGLDAEPLRELEDAVARRVTSEAERERLAALPAAGHPGGWPLLVFSAKEAFYKSYHPLTRTFIGFQDAEVDLDPAHARFEARLVREDAPAAAGRRRFQGRFAIGAEHLVTAVTVLES